MEQDSSMMDVIAAETRETVHNNPGCAAGGCMSIVTLTGVGILANLIPHKYSFWLIVGGLLCLFIFSPNTQKFVIKTHDELKKKLKEITR